MQQEGTLRQIERKYRSLAKAMDERVRRHWAATEAQAYGWGGVSAVSSATGLSRKTIRKGLLELGNRERETESTESQRVRSPGGGRKRLTQTNPKLVERLEWLVDPTTRGDPMSPLSWTCKSTYELAQALTAQGHELSARTVGRLLNEAGFSLQGNRKTEEGADHPDRNAQFEHISEMVKRYQQRAQPVISVDTKKKELVGEFKNGGREWQRKGKPLTVKTHDFMDADLGNAIPYGVYDLSRNEGWVSVDIDHDTARFAAQAIHRWWKKMGAKRYPGAKQLLITADGGGSNGSRSRLWKVALQDLALRLNMPVQVCHFPPGTSKWNKIAHRMFCHITQNWRGQPLVSHEVIVALIANTRTRAGLKIRAELDTSAYPTGTKVSDEQLASINFKCDEFLGDWNYILSPSRRKT